MHCLVCGTPVPPLEKRLKHPDRNPVSHVATLEIHESLRTAAVRRNDAWGMEVKARCDAVLDLVAAEAMYHRQCFTNFCSKRCFIPGMLSMARTKDDQRTPGRPHNAAKESSFRALCNYIEESEECQFTPKELVLIMKEISPMSDTYGDKYLVRLLHEKYAGSLIEATLPGERTLLCFRGTVAKILNRAWYEQRKTDPQEERKRIVQAAAAIVREDIRLRAYDTTRLVKR